MNTASMEEKFSEIVEKNSDSIYESCKKCVDLLEGWGREAQEGFQYFLTQVPLPQYAPGEVPKGFIQIREEEVDAPTQKRIREMEFQIVKELILQDVTEKSSTRSCGSAFATRCSFPTATRGPTSCSGHGWTRVSPITGWASACVWTTKPSRRAYSRWNCHLKRCSLP